MSYNVFIYLKIYIKKVELIWQQILLLGHEVLGHHILWLNEVCDQFFSSLSVLASQFLENTEMGNRKIMGNRKKEKNGTFRKLKEKSVIEGLPDSTYSPTQFYHFHTQSFLLQLGTGHLPEHYPSWQQQFLLQKNKFSFVPSTSS